MLFVLFCLCLFLMWGRLLVLSGVLLCWCLCVGVYVLVFVLDLFTFGVCV